MQSVKVWRRETNRRVCSCFSAFFTIRHPPIVGDERATHIGIESLPSFEVSQLLRRGSLDIFQLNSLILCAFANDQRAGDFVGRLILRCYHRAAQRQACPQQRQKAKVEDSHRGGLFQRVLRALFAPQRLRRACEDDAFGFDGDLHSFFCHSDCCLPPRNGGRIWPRLRRSESLIKSQRPKS